MNKSINWIALAAVMFSVSIGANCQEKKGGGAEGAQNFGGIEWRLLGPAFSKHATLDGAPIVKPASKQTTCTTRIIDLKSGLKTIECVDLIVPQTLQWSQNNPAFGIERAHIYDDHTDKIFVMSVRDSFGDTGTMGGVSRSWPLAQIGSFNVEAGVSGGLWYRTVLTGVREIKTLTRCTNDGSMCYSSGTSSNLSILERRLVPFVFPVFSITEQSTGLGLNIAVAPRLKIGQYYQVPTSTIMMQITYKLNF